MPRRGGGRRPLRRFDVATQDLADVSCMDGVICVIDTLLQYQAGPAPRMRRACSRRAVHINVPARSLPAGPPPSPPLLPPRRARLLSAWPTPRCRCSYMQQTARSSRFRPQHALGVMFRGPPTAHLLALASARDLRVDCLLSHMAARG